ncbi:MAG: DsbA family oxidoreductase [Sulfurospirillaceae bacterium]|nr:DsbA family oxidoreductase [Sulfurospirillaceae bacterium]MDD2825960.1 DsbA family oxidoreductase [Sulfurospirillaceae bacterium]
MILTTKIKIDIISDVVCPWCLVGYKRLEQAMQELGVEEKFELVWNPFELNPTMSLEGENAVDYLAKKYNMSVEKVKSFQATITKNGAELGFIFNYFDGMKTVNTRNAHILLDFAKEFGKQTELKMRLFTAHFTEQKDISNRHVLGQLIQSIGLDTDTFLAKLDDDSARQKVQDTEDYWHRQGVTAVPTMVFNNEAIMNGAYPIATYKQVLTDLLGK